MDMNKNLHQMWQDRERLWSVTNTYCHLSLSRHRRKRLNKDSEGKLREHTDVPLWLLRQSKSLQCAEKWYLDEVRQQTKHLTGTGIQVRPFFFTRVCYVSLLCVCIQVFRSGIFALSCVRKFTFQFTAVFKHPLSWNENEML